MTPRHAPQTASSTAVPTAEAGRPAPRAPRRLLPRRPVVAEGVTVRELLLFQALMAAEGHTVHVGRMCYDRPYAFECIASGHASGHDPLHRLSLLLFQAYERPEATRH